jgi:thioredoxin 1
MTVLGMMTTAGRSAAMLCLTAMLAWGQPGAPGAAAADSSQAIADEIIESDIPVLIDFWAVWCAPCRHLEPIIKSIKKEYAGKILVKKINVDVHRQIAAYFRVSSIPAVYIVKDKTVVRCISGLRPKEAYVNAIDEVLASGAGDEQAR